MARLLAQRERDREDELYERERRHRKNREGKLAFKSRLQDECKSNGALITTHVMVTHPSGETQMVDCGSLSRW